MFHPGLFLESTFTLNSMVNHGLFDPAKSAKVAGTLGQSFVYPDGATIVDVFIADGDSRCADVS